jgi:hypothetical protein
VPKDPERVAIGRLGGLRTAQTNDPRSYTKAARQAFRDSFLLKVDPDGSLRVSDPAEANRRAEAARRAFYAEMTLRRVQAQQKRARRRGHADDRGEVAAVEGVGPDE